MVINYIALLQCILRRSAIFFLILLPILILGSCSESPTSIQESLKQKQLSKKIFDSITTTPSLSEKQIDKLLSNLYVDSLYNDLVFDLSYHYYSQSDSLQFRFWNNKANRRAANNKELKADVQWDLGNFFYRENIIDSSYNHYYRAYRIYKDIGNEYYAARMLVNLGILQENVKDYIGSEVTTIKAIKTLEKLNKKRQLYNAYSNLGIVFNGLDQYNEAIRYHLKAKKITEQIKDFELKATSLNNLGVVFERMQKFDSAVFYYNKALKINDISTMNPRVYAMLLDNLAFSKFKLGPDRKLIVLSRKALNLRDSIDHSSGIIINKLHLAEMYQNLGEVDSAYKILTETRFLASQNNNYDYLLNSLSKLSQVNPNKASQYFESFRKLNDSLVNEERLVRNKFARIRFETDKYIEENKSLSQQQLYLGGFFLASMLIGFLLYLQKDLRAKNRELIFEKEQQNSNEKIYDLIVNEQIRINEAKGIERQRISGDLHDGVLSKLFATRISLSLFGRKLLVQQYPHKEVFENYLSEIQEIEKEIRDISHDLKNDFTEDPETFVKLVKELIKKSGYITKIKIDINVDEGITWEYLPNNFIIHLYRILQESIQHSKGKNLRIWVNDDNNSLILIICDDGQGFKKEKSKGIGLKNMRERAEKLQADFEVTSSERGTTLRVRVPLIKNKYV